MKMTRNERERGREKAEREVRRTGDSKGVYVRGLGVDLFMRREKERRKYKRDVK